jgi:hypothetical protein
MTVFISHSFGDKAQFTNITDALTAAGIPYWDPEEMKAGATLSEQLREAIKSSELCIFVATHKSVESAWCGAELGAFWGVGKAVLIYLADTSLEEDKLPRQYKGHFVEGSIKKIVEAAKGHLAKAIAVDKGDRVKIEGEYRTNDSAHYRVDISHLSDDYYRIRNPEWEGVGLFRGGFYYGAYKVYDDADDEGIRGNWGAHRARLKADKRLDLFGVELKETEISSKFSGEWIKTIDRK